eukprot:6190854-Pleurochrysis_carterae.AAC.3
MHESGLCGKGSTRCIRLWPRCLDEAQFSQRSNRTQLVRPSMNQSDESGRSLVLSGHNGNFFVW